MMRATILLLALVQLLHAQQDVRHLFATLPFTRYKQDLATDENDELTTTTRNLGYSHAAAVQLALDHFHTRNDSVVPQLANLECDGNVTWRVTFTDSKSTGRSSVDSLMDLIAAGDAPHAVIGGYQYGEVPALELTSAANSRDIPSVVYGGSNLRVVQERYYPLSCRTHPDALAFGEPLIDYLQNHLNRSDFFGIMAPAFSEVALQNQQVLKTAAKERNIQTFAVNFEPNEYIPGPTAEKALKELLKTGFRTILLLLDDWEVELEIVARTASELGMKSEDYLWVLVGSLDLEALNLDLPDVVLDLVHGSLYVQPLETFGWFTDDPFLMAWHNQTSDFAERVNGLLPSDVSFRADPSNYFGNHSIPPEHGAGFCYDAVISVLMASCGVSRDQVRGPDAGASLVDRIHHLSFLGASGNVLYDSHEEYPGSRASYTLPFGAYNMLIPTENITTLTAVRKGGKNASDPIKWKDKIPFVFANGLTTGPPLRDAPNGNFLDPAIRITGFVLFALVMLLIVCSSVWVFLKRQERIIRAAQPSFVLTLHFGSALVSLCIMTNSFDESAGVTLEQLSSLCTATPWLLVCGIQVVYSCLWVKLWRINKVLQFRRRAVTISSVVWPAAALFGLVLMILIVWTVLGGFEWLRTVVDPFTGESTAKCVGTTNSVAFFVPVIILMFIPVILTLIMSWKTKDVASEYSENFWLLALVLFQVQLLVITIPLFLLVEDSRSSVRYIVQVIVFFLFSVSTVGLLMGPKVWRYYNPEPTMKPTRGMGGAGRTQVSGVNLTTLTSSQAPSNRTTLHTSANDLNYYPTGRASSRNGFGNSTSNGLNYVAKESATSQEQDFSTSPHNSISNNLNYIPEGGEKQLAAI